MDSQEKKSTHAYTHTPVVLIEVRDQIVSHQQLQDDAKLHLCQQIQLDGANEV